MKTALKPRGELFSGEKLILNRNSTNIEERFCPTTKED
jgi:hypothetical protein